MEQKEYFEIDFDSFHHLYDLHYKPLCEYLNFYTKDIHTIEDVVQEVFLNLWENRGMIEIQHVKTYLFHSTRNKVLNHLRDESNRSRLLENWFQKQLENLREQKEAFDTEHLLSAVYKSIDILPPKCREIFLLCKIEGKSYKQIAELQQVSPKTVENQMGIALKKIRTFLIDNHLYVYPFLLSVFGL